MQLTRLVLASSITTFLLLAACVGSDSNATGDTVPPNGSDAGPSTANEGGPPPTGPVDEAGVPIPPPTPEGKVSWTFFEPTRSSDGASALAVDLYGGAVVAGTFTNADGTGPSELPTVDHGGILIVRLDAMGRPQWKVASVFAGTELFQPTLTGVALDRTGAVFLTGFVSHGMTIGTVTVPANQGYLLKLDPDGKALWVKTFSTTGALAYVTGLATNGDRIVLGGPSGADLTYPGGTLHTSGTNAAWVGVFDVEGNPQWVKGESATIIFASDTTISADGSVFLAGSYGADATGDWGNIPFQAPDGSNRFNGLVVAFDPNGNPRWNKSFANPDHDVTVTSVAANAGVLAIAGVLPGETDLGDGPRQTKGASDAYVAKYDFDGKFDWARTVGGETSNVFPTELLTSVTIDAWGQVTTVGSADVAVSINGAVMPAPPASPQPCGIGCASYRTGYGAKLDGTGANIWTHAINTTKSAALVQVRATPAGAFVATADMNADVDLGDGTIRTVTGRGLGVVGWTP